MADMLADGNTDFTFGQDAYTHPNSIRENQYAKGVNVICRGSALRPRPRYTDFELHFEQRLIPIKRGSRTFESVWRAGKFQAIIPYPLRPDNYLITVVNGLICKTNIANGNTILLTEDVKVNGRASRINWSYAANKIVLFDYPANPVVIDGMNVFRTSLMHKINGLSAPQIPISNMGTYNQNRLFIAGATTEFTAGDAVGNILTPEAPITFTEVFLPSSPFVNQFFSLPGDETVYPITAMGFIQELDSNTGIGPMFVATSKKVFYFKTNQPRAQWTAGQFGATLLTNSGIVGPRAFVNVNSDLVFLSEDGVHALSTSRNESQRWGNVPISREVNNYLKLKEINLTRFAALGYFNNYIFITANPYRVQALTTDGRPITDYANGGMVVLDLASISTMLVEGTPVWDGLWTGADVMDMCNISNRFFMMSKDGIGGSGQNTLYELDDRAGDDIVRGHTRPVRSTVYTKEYDFKQPFVQKKESSMVVHLQDIGGNVKLDIERKPSHSNKFLDYAHWEHEAPQDICSMPPVELLNGIDRQQFKQLIFGDGKEGGCNPVSKDLYEQFRSVQYRLGLQGDWLLEGFKVNAEVVPFVERPDNVTCEDLPEVRLSAQCEPDWIVPDEVI